MTILVMFAMAIALALFLAFIVWLVLRFSDERPILRTGSMEEAEREAKARSYGIDHGPAPGS